ncbi:MAG: MMPL family transporter [Clostridiales Family XIII bacterium]|jgi:predicted RND superfamily exporter protein|nr:MMPL family transporter [Clostridiales Family XIII bacterium]
MYFVSKLIKNKKFVVIISILLAAIFGLLTFLVTVNYNLYDYLPKDSKSIVALEINENNFDEELPNLNALLKVSSIDEVTIYRQKFEQLKGVSNIQSVDDFIDVSLPLSFYKKDDYKDYFVQKADFQSEKNVDLLLFRMFVAEDGKKNTITELKKIVADNGTLTGEVIENEGLSDSSSQNSSAALFLLLPIILIALFFVTKSFFAPFLVFLTIGIAVLINMGTNIFMHDVSFVTFTVGPVLQIAVSLDYAIFLLFSFKRWKEKGFENDEAMKKAVCESFPVIISCGLTTIIGFMALCFMKLGIGANLGLSLGKGVFLSMLSVLVFFPCIVLISYKLIEKTTIRFKKRKKLNLGKYVFKIKIPIFIIIIICILPAFIATQKTDFDYDASNVALTPEMQKDVDEFNKYFPQQDTLIIFLKSGNKNAEVELTKELKKENAVQNVISYQNSVGEKIPEEMVDDDILKNFYSKNWTRLIVYFDGEQQVTNSFSIFKSVRKLTEKYYPKDSYISGNDPVISDLKDVVTEDNFMVNMIIIISIFLVILLVFRSLIMPFILVATIETALWINFAIPYFTGNTYMYVGYIIISSVLLGSCVDYAILLSNRYIAERKTLDKKDAIIAAIGGSGEALFISAFVLTSAGIVLALSTNNEMVRQLGLLLSRGTSIAFFLVVFFLPAALYIFDWLIKKLSVGYKMR